MSCYRHTQICKDLLGAGAEVNAKDKVHQWTPLMQATHQKYVAMVTMSYKRGQAYEFVIVTFFVTQELCRGQAAWSTWSGCKPSRKERVDSI